MFKAKNIENKTVPGGESKTVKKKLICYVSNSDIYWELKQAFEEAFIKVLDKYVNPGWIRSGELCDIGKDPVSEYYTLFLNKSEKKRLHITISYRISTKRTLDELVKGESNEKRERY